MKRIIFMVLIATMFLYSEIGDWRTFCSISHGNDIISNDNKIYIATDGGLLVYDNGDEVIIDTDDGLLKINTTFVEKDFRDVIWVGHEDCSISLFEYDDRPFSHVRDIEEFGSYKLNNIFSSEEYVYIATDKALVRYAYNYDFDKYDVIDTNQMTGNVSDVCVFGQKIYISTPTGIFSVDEDNGNIGYMDNWNAVTGMDPGTIVNCFIPTSTDIIALTNNGIYHITGNSSTKSSLEDGTNVLYGYIYNNYLYYTVFSTEMIFSRTSDFSTAEEIFRTSDPDGSRFILNDDLFYFISDTGFSIYDTSEDATTNFSFNLPKVKGIKKIRFTHNNDRLLYLSSRSFSEYDITEQIFRDDLYTESKLWSGMNFVETSDNDVYVSTWSTGIARFKYVDTGYVFEERYVFGSITPPPPNGGLYYPYATHPGICKDKYQNVWITNFSNLDGDSTVVRLSSDGEIGSYTLPNFQSPYKIYIDNFDWVWLGSSSQQFNERDGLGIGKVEGDTLIIKQFTGLGGIIDILRDTDNIVWIGTNSGLKYIDLGYLDTILPGDISDIEPENISSGYIESIVDGPVGNMIYDIEINDRNEKWFATDRGVSVLSKDNTSWRHYVPYSFVNDGTVDGQINFCSLPDQSITDIEINSANGIIAFSSYNGISFYEVIPEQKLHSDEVVTSPSPFLNDGFNNVLFIFPDDGNTYNTAKIFDLRGSLVRGPFNLFEVDEYERWDGKDNNGNVVSSGVYQIVAFNNSDPSEKIIGKIAVVRK